MSKLRLAFIVWLLPLCAVGCSILGSSLTGGSIPKGILQGQVLSAEAPNAPIADAQVLLTVRETGQQLVTTTDAVGKFRFDDVPLGTIEVSVIPPVTLNQLGRTFQSSFSGAIEPFILIPLLPAGQGAPPLPVLSEFRLTPPRARLRVGDSVQFQLATLPATDIPPVWTVSGDIGEIDVNGRFTARRPGTGTVTAHLDSFIASARVTVTSRSE